MTDALIRSSGAQSDTSHGLTWPQRRVGGVIALATLMVMLDVTVTAVAVPTLTESFRTDLATVQWVTTAYALALVAVMPLSAWAIGRFGARRLYLGALSLFVVGSALAGLAWNIESLIVFRAIQGLGGGFLQPVGMSIAIGAVDQRNRGKMMALLGLPLLVGPVAGPTLGGWMVDAVGWRSLFLVNVPIGVVAIMLGAIIFPRSTETAATRLDWTSLACLSPGGALVVFGLAQAGDRSVADPRIVVPVALGLILLGLFVRRSLRSTHPILNLRLLRRRTLASGVATMALFAGAYFGSMLIMPIYVQAVRGDSATTAGMVTIGQAVVTGIGMQIATRLVDRVEPKRIIVSGIATSLIAMTLFAVLLDAHTGYLTVGAIGALMGVGVGATMMPTITAATRGLAPSEIPSGTTILSTANQLMAAVGAAAMTALLTTLINGRTATLDGGGVSAALSLTDTRRAALADDLAAGVSGTYVLVAAVLAAALLVATVTLPARVPQHDARLAERAESTLTR